MVMFAVFPLAGIDSPCVQFGWRIPFVIGAALAGVLALYYTFKVSESEIWEVEAPDAREKLPLSDLLRGRSGRHLLQVLVMMTGFWLTQNIITIFIPTTLLHQLHLSNYQLTLTLLISYTALFFSYTASGIIGQAIGRRTFFVIAGPLIASMGAAILYVLVNVGDLTLPVIVLAHHPAVGPGDLTLGCHRHLYQ
jgi:Na+/melibiose symporter-like transporter